MGCQAEYASWSSWQASGLETEIRESLALLMFKARGVEEMTQGERMNREQERGIILEALQNLDGLLKERVS